MGVLTLGALLLGSYDLEVAVVKSVLLLLSARVPLLSYLTPTAARLVFSWAGSVAFVNQAFVSKLTAPQKLFSKVAAVHVDGGSVD